MTASRRPGLRPTSASQLSNPESTWSREINQTVATTHSAEPETRQNAAAAAARRCGEMLIDLLKSLWASWCENCTAYWIGAHPGVWGVRK